jgi:hypothetical protein
VYSEESRVRDEPWPEPHILPLPPVPQKDPFPVLPFVDEVRALRAEVDSLKFKVDMILRSLGVNPEAIADNPRSSGG